MALELRQNLKLTQQLVMTPQLQQAIRLLQLSRLELIETVQQELMENPFLEEGYTEAANESMALESTRSENEAYDANIAKDADWEDYLGDFSSTSRQATTREVEMPEDMTSYESRFSAQPSLEGHLLWQLRLSHLTERQQEIGEFIIGNLGSSGYLEASVEDLCGFSDASAEEVEETLKLVQQFDPVGVASRNAKECLLTQIYFHGYDADHVLVGIIQDHLEDLEKRRYKPLLRKFKITMEDLGEYLDFIQTLDPFPGASFGSTDTHFVSPDVYVYQIDGEFVIVLNEDGLPQLQVSDLYTDFEEKSTGEEKEYMQDKMRSATWLIKSIHQRQRTLYKVMESIIKYQAEFFIDGVGKLKPLILKDIAEDIGMHESTVSRITSSKYVATHHGVFELKFFFNSALVLDDGSEVGSESVKDLIKKYIGEEHKTSPLSDERIADMLKDVLKVNIARRTVAKYRTALNIESSSRRRVVF